MEEQSPETTRRIQREQDRRENKDIINKCWTILINEFINYSLGDIDPTQPAFSNILDAAIEFVNACHKEKKRYTEEEIAELLYQMRENMREKLTFHAETLPLTQQTIFYSSFKSFITATKKTFLAQANDPESGEHFQRLALWLPEVLSAAVFSLEESCSLSAETYCVTHREKIETVKRIGSAIAVFVDCHSLQNTDISNLVALDKEHAIAHRTRELCSRYQSLRSGLFRVRRLTADLEHRLMTEERNHYAAIQTDPYKSSTPFTFADEILAILNEILKNDTAEVLNQFLPKGKRVPETTQTLCDLITREYFHYSESSTDAEHEAERTEASQAPLTAQAILEVDTQYKNLFSRFMRLLGKEDILTSAALTEIFRNVAPSEQLEILERLCVAIAENTDDIYDTVKQPLSQKNDSNYSKTQLKHIEILQKFYLGVIKANPLEIFGFRIAESQLLDYKVGGKKPMTAKLEAKMVWDKQHQKAVRLAAQSTVKNTNVANSNHTASK